MSHHAGWDDQDIAATDGVPWGFVDCGLEMSNFDHTVDAGLAERLKEAMVFGRHSAWNFNGQVWWDGKLFREQVWRFGVPLLTFSADNLRDLMEIVNDRYGWD